VALSTYTPSSQKYSGNDARPRQELKIITVENIKTSF
jgi:hypothetical protein